PMAGRRIAVLSPGEMGSQVGRLLREAGNDVVTVTAGRSERSRRRATEAGMRDLPDLDELASVAELIICVVPSLSAEPLARSVAAAVAKAPMQTGVARLKVDPEQVARHTRELTARHGPGLTGLRAS
ncbi:MAG: 6-phosphogluconate dehydrogenase, partial [Anaerolineae bacterium]|nr:6-phosphogluconate dehydrogenase [Anaerolineae bacterium]